MFKYFLLFLGFTIFLVSCQNTNTIGKEIYERNCSNCHQSDGSGLGELIPTLDQNPYFVAQRDSLACLLLLGKETNDSSDFFMPPIQLSPVELTNLMNYLQQAFSPVPHEYSLEEVKHCITTCN